MIKHKIVSTFLLACFSPTITLIPGTSSLAFPVEFQRNEDFSVISIIQFNCNDSLSMSARWSIHRCISNCSTPIQINPTVITTFSELYIPSQTLDYGIYELRLTVTTIIALNLTSTASAFITIIPSSIIVNLIQVEASMIANGFNQNLTLNPGIYSVDLDGFVFNGTVSNNHNDFIFNLFFSIELEI
jgi:hypothetical protein